MAWLCFYALFLLYALVNHSGFLFLDYVNLMIHEGGHFFFSWFGYTITILGGTLGELLARSSAPSISFGSGNPPALLFPASGSSRTFPTSAPTWPMRVPQPCLWLAPATPTGKFSSPNGASSPRTRESAESCAPSAGLACSPPSLGLPTERASTRPPGHGSPIPDNRRRRTTFPALAVSW